MQVLTELPQDNAKAEIAAQNIQSMCSGKQEAINNAIIKDERTKKFLQDVKYDAPELNS